MASETKRRRWLPAPFSRRATIVWAVIVAVLLVAGAYFMYDRLANGLGMAGATNSVPWGLWVVVYIWFSGLAGGLYLLSALVYLLRIPRFAPVARMALGLSVVSLVVSMIFIGIDLGAIRHSLERCCSSIGRRRWPGRSRRICSSWSWPSHSSCSCC